ncbi:uncharacterized protein LOC143858636 [Tasmannia lanceolata]|uniref:uncharacterized protein LOC143858636 n=1 Tax=Tasmannia lanceolata TaxID=3420 RepID=UPI0040647C4E
MSDSTSDSESGTGSSTSSISEFRMPQEPFLASPSDRIDLVDSDDGGDRDEVILDLNATPPLTGSLPRAGGSVESDVAEASTTFLPGRAVEVIARARMDADPKYNLRALVEENYLTRSMLGDIRDKYCVPPRFELRAAIEGDRACNESQDLCIYEESLRAGLRFPLHPFFSAVLRYYGLAPAQVAPNSWRLLVGFLYLVHGRLERSVTLSLFRACAHLKKHKEGGWIYISQRPERKIITGIPSSIHSWKNRFFYVVDQEASEPWSVPLVWDTPDTSKLSRKPLLEGEDSITFALMRKEIEQSGLIRCKEFSEEAILVGLGVSAATPEQMKKQSTVEKIRQGAQPRAQEGAQQAQQERQKRKATVLGSPAPSQGIPPPSQRPKTKVKLVGPFAQGGGSSKSGGASTGAGSGARPPAGISEQVFRPNWAVLKDDTALGESRVAAELMSKCLLQKDKQQVLYEPPATGEEAVLSSAYQILLYYNDLKEKSKSFSQAITSSEEVNGKLAAEVQELQTSIGRIEEEKKLLKEDLAAEKRKLAKAAEAMEAQRGRATDRQEKAVKEATEAKEAELFSLSSEAYSLGYYDCLQELQACNPNLLMQNMTLPARPKITDEEPDTPADTPADITSFPDA